MEHDRFANSKNYSNDQVPSRIVKVSFLEGVIVRLRYPETSLERIKIILTPYYLKGRTRKGMNR